MTSVGIVKGRGLCVSFDGASRAIDYPPGSHVNCGANVWRISEVDSVQGIGPRVVTGLTLVSIRGAAAPDVGDVLRLAQGPQLAAIGMNDLLFRLRPLMSFKRRIFPEDSAVRDEVVKWWEEQGLDDESRWPEAPEVESGKSEK